MRGLHIENILALQGLVHFASGPGVCQDLHGLLHSVAQGLVR